MRIRDGLALVALSACGAAYGQSTSVEVRDRTGAAVDEARIEIFAGEEVAATVSSGEDGSAEATLDEGNYRARVTAAGYVVGWSPSFVQTADAPASASVVLFPGSAMAATVLDDKDEPVPGAEVCLELHDSGRYPPIAFGEGLLDDGRQCFDTDDRGQLVTPVLPLGAYDLAVEAAELVPRKMSLKLAPDFAAQIWKLNRGGRIEGRVEDQEENPVPGAAVNLRHRELEAEHRGVTDDEGRFEIRGLAPGPWSVRIEPRTAAMIARDGIGVKAGVATDLGLLRVPKGLSVRGRVVTEDGEPVARAEIQARTVARVTRPLRTVESDEDGRFVVAGLGEDAVHLLIDAPEGHASTAIEEIEPPRRDLEIVVTETGTVCGVVLTEDGEVAAGSSVTVLPTELGLLDRFQSIVRSTTREVDPETGAFCVEDAYPGERVPVTAGAAGYIGDSERIEIVPGQEAGPVELTLKRGLSLEGSVVTSDGTPLPDAAVRARRGGMVFTDTFGEFRLTGLSEGMNTIIAEHPDHAMSSREAMLPLGEEEVFVIELGSGGSIEGTVSRPGGEPVEGVPIKLSFPDRTELTDVEGRFRFDPVPAGERTVTRKSRTSFDDFEHRLVEVTEGEEVSVAFTLGAVLEGQVLRGGAPMPGVSIVLARPDDVAHYTDVSYGVQRTYSDESGAYRLAGVRPGWGTVTLQSGGQTVVRQVEVPPGDEPRQDLYFPEHRITGTVLSETERQAVEGAHVGAGLAPSPGAPQSAGNSSYSSNDSRGGISYNLTSNAESRTVTDAAGNFEVYVDALPELEVSAWARGYRHKVVRADPTDESPLLIELPRETRLVVRLRDPRGGPALGANVCAMRQTDGSTTGSHCTMGGTDEATFSLDEGTYKILASATGFGTKVTERELKRREDGQEHRIDLTLAPGAPLHVRLVGQPTDEAGFASLIDPDGADRTDLVKITDVDTGTGDRVWQTWPLDSGRWTVTVDPGSGKPLVREVEVVPGSPIEVVLP